MPHPKHELNSGFDWVEAEGPYRRLDADQARSYNERGYVILEDVFDCDTVRELVAEIDPWEEKVEAFLRTRPDGRLFIARADEITFSTHLVTKSEKLREFCSGAVFQDITHDLIGPDVRLYWDQAVYKKAGATSSFPWHQDNGYTFVEPQQYLTCWVALTDATEENGCPWVVQGLHRQGTRAHRLTDLGWVCFDEEPAEPIAAPVRAGGIVVLSSLTPHATGPNLTAGVRKSYIVQFAPDGAAVCHRDDAGALTRTPADAAERQFPVLCNGDAPAR
jgi:ectoine hydroxylase-related dioxygenase (phytanoyl-CoA dioxygenase family)